MAARGEKQKRVSEDADQCLRASSRLFPEALTPFVLSEGESVASVEWTETQIALRRKRLDRTLLVRIATGESRWLHVEWTDRLNRQALERFAEYHWNLSAVAIQDAVTRRKNGVKGAVPIGIESVIVVLRGRKKSWPKFGMYRSSAPNQKFSGVRFRIEAVYQKTVEELESMNSLFWLAFVPLARGVNEDKLGRVINKLRQFATEYEFADLLTTMLSLAKLKKGGQELVDVIASVLKKGVPVRSFELFYTKEMEWIKSVYRTEGNIEGRIIGRREGRKEGRVEGREEGRVEGREEGLVLLRCQFERKLQRELTDDERRRLNRRFLEEGPKKLADVILDYSKSELAQWLAPRK